PGHFRFLCHGEKVLHLEISLGYQNRGVERRLLGGPDRRSLVISESIAGDTVVGHALCHCRVVDALCGTRISARAMTLRGVALEPYRTFIRTASSASRTSRWPHSTLPTSRRGPRCAASRPNGRSSSSSTVSRPTRKGGSYRRAGPSRPRPGASSSRNRGVARSP